MRLPNPVDRVVHPDPAAVTVPLDAPAAYSRSPADVVVIAPVLIAAAVPVAERWTSTGLTLSTPLYSLK